MADFIENRYFRWYMALTAASDEPSVGYREKHHRIPRSIGGVNGVCNVVLLSPRKHFLAHWLLTKCTEGRARRSMLFALACMRRDPNGKRILKSWQYHRARTARSEAMRGRVSNFKGRQHSAESLQKMSMAVKGRILSPEHRAKISAGLLCAEKKPGWPKGRPAPERVARLAAINAGNKYRLGSIVSEQTRAKLSAAGMGNKSKTGMKESAETRQRKREAQLRRYAMLRQPTKQHNLQEITI